MEKEVTNKERRKARMIDMLDWTQHYQCELMTFSIVQRYRYRNTLNFFICELIYTPISLGFFSEKT